MFFQSTSTGLSMHTEELRSGLYAALDRLGPRQRVLIIPPDFTRWHSHSGALTVLAWHYYQGKVCEILPALGTHAPMSDGQIDTMFPGIPRQYFFDHDWRNGVVTLGEVDAEFIREISGGVVDFSWPAQLSRRIVDGHYDLVLSIGQVVPHEVVGMAGHAKNIFVGTGGAAGIARSHYLGAVHGMERIMGRWDNPVRRVLCSAAERFLRDVPLVYVQTVLAADTTGSYGIQGMFIGDDLQCFIAAAGLSVKRNLTLLEAPLDKVVVSLDPAAYHSTWLGNKAIYRTRMAIADGGELVIVAPGVAQFGEDAEIDCTIRRYGYRGTRFVLDYTAEKADLQANLGAAAHLIHGSTDGRFTITYAAGGLTQSEVESVGFAYADCRTMQAQYPPDQLLDGFNERNGERFFYVRNPGQGLWAVRERFFTEQGHYNR